MPTPDTVASSSAPVVANAAAESAAGAITTPEPAAAPQVDPEGIEIIGREETVVYHDQNGRQLDEAEVEELKAQGKVSIEHKYETRTRLIDHDGNELGYHMPDGRIKEGQAPPHPDVENVDQSTLKAEGEEMSVGAEAPPTVDAQVDREKESGRVEEEKRKEGEASPGSARDEATAVAATA